MALQICDRGDSLEIGKLTLSDKGAALLTNPHVQEAYLGGAWPGARRRRLRAKDVRRGPVATARPGGRTWRAHFRARRRRESRPPDRLLHR